MPSRRNILKVIFAAAPLAATANAFIIEPNILSTTRLNLSLPNLPIRLDGLRVAHLTDFHHKPEIDDALLEKTIAAVNQEEVDLIVLTGDFITDETDIDNQILPKLLNYLKQLKSNYGIYASLGNHDGWSGPRDYFIKQFKAAGIRLLINESEALEIDNETIYIAGTDFVWMGEPDPVKTLRHIPQDACILALVHEPDYFDEIVKVRDVDLQLSGHTHGGQCRVPLIGYAPISVKYGKKYVYGHFAKGASQLFVSRGIGTSGKLRVRFACPPELALITLHSAKKSLS